MMVVKMLAAPRSSRRLPGLLVLTALWLLLLRVNGHGRLVEPPSRASMWRYGYGTPVDYHDNQLFCGGFTVQWVLNGGRCGVCGDAWTDDSSSEAGDHEVGGRFFSGIVVRRYVAGQLVLVIVQLTAAHRGYFEFRLCPATNNDQEVTQECLDRHLLTMSDGRRTRYIVEADAPSLHQLTLRLPQQLTCHRCLLQWKYHSGNSWGMDEESGRSCLGCGPQEEFYGCSDIAIGQPTDHEHTPPHHLLPLSPSHHQHHHQQQTQQHFSVRRPAGLFQSSSALASMSETERTSSFGQTEDLTESNELRRINPEEEVRRIHSSDGAKTSRVDDRSSSSSLSSSFSSPWHRLSDPADQWTTGQEWTEVVFDGQRHNVSVIKRHPRRHMTSQQLPMSVDRLDLVPLGKREPVFVLPRWYMFEDRATKQITLVEPEVIKSTLKEMVKNGGQSGRSSGKTMTSGKNRSRGQMRSRDWKLISVPAADSRMDGIERLLRIESTPIRTDQWRKEETVKDVTYSVDNSSPSSPQSSSSSSIPSPPLSTPSSSPHPTPSPPSSSPPSPLSSSSPPPSPSTSPSLPPSQPSSYSSSAPSPSPSTPHFFPVTSSSRPASHPNEAAMSSSVKAGGEAENSAKISPAGREPEGGGRRRMERTTVAPNALHKILFISQRQARPWNKNSGR